MEVNRLKPEDFFSSSHLEFIALFIGSEPNGLQIPFYVSVGRTLRKQT